MDPAFYEDIQRTNEDIAICKEQLEKDRVELEVLKKKKQILKEN